jgi:hypothetical protein
MYSFNEHLLKLLFTFSSTTKEIESIIPDDYYANFKQRRQQREDGTKCQLKYTSRIPDGVGSQAYKRISWFLDSQMLNCKFEHESFISRVNQRQRGNHNHNHNNNNHNNHKRGQLIPPNTMQHNTDKSEAELFFNLHELETKHDGRLAKVVIPECPIMEKYIQQQIMDYVGNATEQLVWHQMSGNCFREMPILAHKTHVFNYHRYMQARYLLIASYLNSVKLRPLTWFFHDDERSLTTSSFSSSPITTGEVNVRKKIKKENKLNNNNNKDDVDFDRGYLSTRKKLENRKKDYLDYSHHQQQSIPPKFHPNQEQQQQQQLFTSTHKGKFAPRPLHVCIHMRRGDITPWHPSNRHESIETWLTAVQPLMRTIDEVSLFVCCMYSLKNTHSRTLSHIHMFYALHT